MKSARGFTNLDCFGFLLQQKKIRFQTKTKEIL